MNYKQTDWLGTALAAVVIVIVVATYIVIIVLIYAATRDAPPIALDTLNSMSTASAAPPTTIGSSLTLALGARAAAGAPRATGVAFR
jgi:hypothetical protein